MSFSLQDFCCIVGKFVFLSSQSLFVPLLPSHLLFTSNNLFSAVDQEYSVHTIPHEFQYPRIRISSILLCASNGVDCRVESSISPGARLHGMIIIANQVQSTEIFHPPILIPVVCLYCCVCVVMILIFTYTSMHIIMLYFQCVIHVYCWIWSSPIFIPKLIVMCVPNQTISPIFIDTDSTTDVPQLTNTAHILHILLSRSL